MTDSAVAAASQNGAEIMEQVIVKGDLSNLTPQERSNYYMTVCKSVGLNPLTKPFEYIKLNGRLTLYALRTCTDQLRTIHGVSVEDMTESERDGVFIVTAKVRDKAGRTDMSKGAVTIGNLKGDALCNALMKAETKAKRRATLSICGLGFLDESEIETIPDKAKAAPRDITPKREPPKAVEAQPPTDPETGEVLPPSLFPVPQTADGKRPDWATWGVKMAAALRAAATAAAVDDWLAENDAPFRNCKHDAPKFYARLVAIADERREALAEVAPDMPAEVALGEPDPMILKVRYGE